MIRSVSAAGIRCLSTSSKTILTTTATHSTRHAARAKCEVASVLDSARRLYPVAARVKSRARNLRQTRRDVEQTFSKKSENHCNMVAPYAVWYNFIRIHKTLRVTPVMKLGIIDRLYSRLRIRNRGRMGSQQVA